MKSNSFNIEPRLHETQEELANVRALLRAEKRKNVELEQEITKLRKELEGHRAFRNSVSEALNSGDGVYRP